MKEENPKGLNKVLSLIKDLIKETDIRLLVFVPPVMGFGGLLIFAFMYAKVTGHNMVPPLNYMAIGTMCFITGISGVAEVYKREMPGPLGGVVKGTAAIVSGVLAILLSCFFGGAMFYISLFPK